MICCLSLRNYIFLLVIFHALFCCRKEEKKLDESIMPSPKTEIDLQFYGGSELEQGKNLTTENIENAFAMITDITEKIHNYYICSKRKCTDICHLVKAKMRKDTKFQHKWLFDPTVAKCSYTGIWCLTNIDGLGMSCAVCQMSNASQLKNDSKVWNSGLNVRYETETVQGHLVCTLDHKTMHGDGVGTEKLRKSYFVEKEREEASKVNKAYEKVFHAAYWLAKEEIPW